MIIVNIFFHHILTQNHSKKSSENFERNFMQKSCFLSDFWLGEEST